MKKCIWIFFVLLCSIVKGQIYYHNFGITPISTFPYNVPPSVIDINLSGSSWVNTTSSWTSYAGSSGEAIALSNSGGTPTITLSINVANGYKLDVTGFNFWQQRSTTGAQNWSMAINGIPVGSGTVPTTGAAIGTTSVASPVTNLSGTVSIVISLSGASGAGTYRLDDFTLNGSVNPNAYVLLDNFNRNDTIRPAIPSSGGPAFWVEQEVGVCFSGSVLEKIRIKNNRLELSSCTYSNSTCFVGPTEATSINMTGKYPTVFSTSASIMEWYLNMQQSIADPTGFSSGQSGAAFVIGSTTNNPFSGTKQGYAVVYGEAGTADPIRLVSFDGTFFNSSTFTNILSVPSPAVKTDYMSIKVTYNPCNNEWSLTVRDDGLSFADPSTISGVGAIGINSTFTSTNLFWLGAVWNNGPGCCLDRFDNIYIPNSAVYTGIYIWNGSSGTDFQSPNNWTPRRQCAKPSDKLVINSSSPAASILTNIPDQTISQLTVTNNRTATIRDVAGDGLPSTITIAGGTGTDLIISAGSTLIFDVSTVTPGDAMIISLGTGVTGDISGIVSFNSQVGGTKSHRLIAADPLAITVNAGGIVKAVDLLGNPFGISLPTNIIVFNSGAVYECYSGANPFGLPQPASKVVFNTGSIYRQFSSNQPSVLGRIYANYESNVNTDITFGGPAPFTVDLFKVVSGTFKFSGTANSQPIHTNIKGDLILLAGTGFVYDPVAPSECIFNSAIVAQRINSMGTLTFGRLLTVRLNSTFATAPQLTIETPIAIAGVLDIVQGTLKLSADVTIISDSVRTASIAAVYGALSYGTGKFIIERYIPAHPKAWQFLAVPTMGQTVNAAWQEGNGPMLPGTPGLGTIITSNTPGTGFDFIGGFAPSMKTYDTTGAGLWKGITRTDTAIYNPKGYMIFVRGDRTVSSTNAPATATKLRTTGQVFDLVTLPPVTQVGPDKFESVGNPFAAAIDFSNDASIIKSANVQKIFYVWDPKLGGGLGYGGYQTFTRGTLSDNNYYVSPGGGSYGVGGSVSSLVQSGQAFFVHTVGGAGSITFTESAKVNGSALVTRMPVAGLSSPQQLRINLYSVSGFNSTLVDGILHEFHRTFSKRIDILDAIKLKNIGENFGIYTGDTLLSVERRSLIVAGDTLFYRLQNLKVQQYEFEMLPANISRPGLIAYLEDRYVGISTPVSLTSATRIPFEVFSDPASSSPGRFRLVFSRKRWYDNETESLPYSFLK